MRAVIESLSTIQQLGQKSENDLSILFKLKEKQDLEVKAKIEELLGKDCVVSGEISNRIFTINNKNYGYKNLLAIIEDWKQERSNLINTINPQIEQYQARVNFIEDKDFLEVQKNGSLLFYVNLKTKEPISLKFTKDTFPIMGIVSKEIIQKL